MPIPALSGSVKSRFEIGVRAVLASILLFSSAAKLLTIRETVRIVGTSVGILSSQQVFWAVLLLSIVELAVAALLISGSGRLLTFGALSALALFSLFAGASLIRVVSAGAESCGCFGSLRFLDEPGIAFIRDLVLLVGAVSLTQRRLSKSGFRKVLAGVLPLVAFGSTILSVANPVFGELDDFELGPQTAKSDWYGIRTRSVNGRGAWEIATDSGIEATPKAIRRNAGTPSFTVYGKDDSSVVGWIVLLGLPMQKATTGVFRLGLCFSEDLKLLSIVVQSPRTRNSRLWPREDSLNRYLRTILDDFASSYLAYGSNDLILDHESSIGKYIANAINNSRTQLLLLQSDVGQ